jgi:hypothetical protein
VSSPTCLEASEAAERDVRFFFFFFFLFTCHLTWIHLTPCIIDGPWLLFFLEKKICLEQKKKQLADVFSSRSLLVLDFGALDGIIVVVFFFYYRYELLFFFLRDERS